MAYSFKVCLEESDYLFTGVGFTTSLVKSVFPFPFFSVTVWVILDFRELPASDLEVSLSNFNQQLDSSDVHSLRGQG